MTEINKEILKELALDIRQVSISVSSKYLAAYTELEELGKRSSSILGVSAAPFFDTIEPIMDTNIVMVDKMKLVQESIDEFLTRLENSDFDD